MHGLLSFYTSRISRFQEQLKQTKKQLFLSSMLRLAIFLTAVFLVYVFFEKTNVLLLIILGTIVLFVLMVSRHSNLQAKRDKINALINLNKTEINVLHRNFSDLPDGSEFKDPTHHFSQDIDLFGKGSFFQYLNRTSLREGKLTLAHLLTENEIGGIEEKQAAVTELAKKVGFRQEFSALASLIRSENTSASVIKWMAGYTSFTPKFSAWLPNVFSGISLLVLIGYFIDIIPGAQLALWFMIGLLITGVYLKKINAFSTDLDKAQGVFQQYHRLLALLEMAEFSSKLLTKKQKEIHSEKKKASEILKTFSKTIDALDQRNNLIFGILGNGFLLWDLKQAHKLEKWMGEYSKNVAQWFKTIEFMDAHNSLGNFAYNHKHYTFPEIISGKTIINAKDAVHPLIDPSKSIKNDYTISEAEFLIITGANMAGKSTFLRTVSLQIVMSNVGLPVCAMACSYTPIKLITSMRTTDSLSDEASYFYSELTRLKFIVDELKIDRYFVVLDEILKGTNSTDKAIGSQKFIEKLVHSNSTGIIATHDLSLCETAKEFPEIKNYYFDAEIIDDELHFDYKFKKGVCKNMNASFLLKKMEIID